MQNSMMLFTFFVFECQYPFWVNLVQKIKIISLSWNLVSRLIQICRIQWWYLLFLLLMGNTLFWANLVQKIKIISWSWNLVPRLIQICWIQLCCSLFSFLTRNALLGQIWSKLSIFTDCFASNQKYPFLEKFGPKCQSC